jgi:Co/Zn/Cd efflux system component
MADAAVSVLAIIGLVLARTFGWLWMDALTCFVGALVIANGSYGLVRDTSAFLLGTNPNRRIPGADIILPASSTQAAGFNSVRRWRTRAKSV